MALVVAAVPPLGLIGWASPLTAAGVLFPTTAWLGLTALLILSGTMAVTPRVAMPVALALAGMMHLVPRSEVRAPKDWEVVSTEFGGTATASADLIAEFTAGEWMQVRARDSAARVVVFPESVISRWNDATEAFWEPTLLALASRGRTIIVGAGKSLPSELAVGNVLVVRGQEHGEFSQRVPVPIGMWRPFWSEGVPLNLLGASTLSIDGERAAVLICYEQLLVWPVLRSALERPTLLLGVSNVYWARQTPIPAIQRAALQAWARLFGLPALSATNT